MEDTVFFLESPQQISAAHQPYGGDYYDSSGDDDDGDFEFAVPTTDPEHDTSIAADEVFSGGRMLPVFNGGLRRSPPTEEEKDPPRLLGPEHRALASDPDDLEDLPAGTYCVWAPPRSAERCPKSSSTGSASSSRRSRLIDFVTKRSHSDGKERFVSLQRAASARNPNPNPKAVAAEAKKDAKVKGGKGTETDMSTAHRLYYGKDRGQAAGSGRRTYLPYRQELMVGFFGHGNGLSRSHDQFVS